MHFIKRCSKDDLLHSTPINDPVVSVEGQLVSEQLAESSSGGNVLRIALERLQLRVRAFTENFRFLFFKV